MPRVKTAGLVFVFLAFSLSLISVVQGLPLAEVDLIGVVNNVTDGDTFDVIVANGTQFTIRLADVNASENGQVGFTGAKDYLESVVYGKTIYLDVDDVYVTDYRGTGNRLVCVVYIEFNSTHFLNVNQALIDAGHVEVKDYDNEFDPYRWSSYVSNETIPEMPSTIMIPLIIAITFLSLVIIRKYPKEEIKNLEK